MVNIYSGDIPPSVLADLRALPIIACDTETSGLDWAVDRLNLCQLFAPTYGTVFVRIGEKRPENFIALIEEPRTKKVFHHAPFDLAFMQTSWSIEPQNILCTKIASKLISGNKAGAHSLKALLADRLGVYIGKGVTRTSDWSALELTSDQMRYAADDVIHLIPLYESLLLDLRSDGLEGLYNECCRFLASRSKLDQLGVGDVFSY